MTLTNDFKSSTEKIFFGPKTQKNNLLKNTLSIRVRNFAPEVGKHPDLMVGPPTSTVFPTNDRKFEISQFFRKKFEKI